MDKSGIQDIIPSNPDQENKCRINADENYKQSQDLQETLRYFKLMFNCSIDCPDVNNDTTSLKCTAFHTALAKGDLGFITKTFDHLQDDNIRKFVANNLVSYNDKQSIYDILDNSSTGSGIERKSSMLHHNKKHTEGICWKYPQKKLLFESPLALAAFGGKFEGVEILLKYNADIFKPDTKGNNILHSLVLISSDWPEIAVSIFQKLSSSIGALTCVEEKHQLAFMENSDGYTALDLAGKLCLPEMMLAFLQWNDVYRFVMFEYGPFQHVYYDLTRYKQKDSKTHILREVSLASEQDIKRLSRCNFIEQEPIKTWMKATIETLKIQRRCCTIWWAINIVMFLLTTLNYLNNDKTFHPHIALSIILLLYALLEIFTQVVSAIYDRAAFGLKGVMFIINERGGLPMAFTPMNRSFQFYFAICMIPLQICHLLKLSYDNYKYWYTTLYVLAVVWTWLSLTVFIPLSSSMGHLLIIMEKMISTASQLYLTYLVILFIFPTGIHLLKIHAVCENTTRNITEAFNISNITTPKSLNLSGIASQFSPNSELSFLKTIYDTLLYGIGYYAPSPLYFDVSAFPELSLILYVALLIFMAIIVMNLAIAVMSDRVTELHKYKDTIQGIQKLSMSLSMISEEILMIKLIPEFKVFGRRTTKYRERYFLTNADKTQVFLRVIEKMSHLK